MEPQPAPVVRKEIEAAKYGKTTSLFVDYGGGGGGEDEEDEDLFLRTTQPSSQVRVLEEKRGDGEEWRRRL